MSGLREHYFESAADILDERQGRSTLAIYRLDDDGDPAHVPSQRAVLSRFLIAAAQIGCVGILSYRVSPVLFPFAAYGAIWMVAYRLSRDRII
jgi:hypothetical protein